MRLFKSHPLLKLVNSYVVDSPQPSNLSYWWNFGSLLAFSLIIQIITGVTLAMHYNTSVADAFNSVEHIMRDINNGWLIRYLHSNTASAFFFIVYLHIGRGLYYGSYKSPRTLVWTIGTIIFIVMMGTAFLGYVLPFGQMSLWGATVITSLMSAIPWVGQDIVEFIWGGFSVNNATLNRFFALHFVLPFVLAALALMHLIALHDRAGSGNPLGVSGNSDRLPFAPYYIFKDLITIFTFILVLSIFVFYMPNILGDSENYVMANPMQTPSAIVPEWYLLPFYAILRSIPNKLLGVIAMFSAILMLLVMPIADSSKSRGIQFRPFSKIIFFIFIGNFLVLTQLGAEHVESPFIEFGQICTVIYFAYFLLIIPFVSLFENGVSVLWLKKNIITKISSIISANRENKEDIENFIVPNYAVAQSFVASPIFFKYVKKDPIYDTSNKGNNANTARDMLTDDEIRDLEDLEHLQDLEDLQDPEYIEDIQRQYMERYGNEDSRIDTAFAWIQAREEIRETKGILEKVENSTRDMIKEHEITPAEEQWLISLHREGIKPSYEAEYSMLFGPNYEAPAYKSSANTPEPTTNDQPSGSSESTNTSEPSSNPEPISNPEPTSNPEPSDTSNCDAPRPWGIYFQDSGTPQMEALVELHDNIMFYLIIILFGVGWLLITIINKFGNMASPLSQRFASHGTSIEVIWTVTPGIILILIAFPSYKLLYLMDEISDPILVIFVEGHQWYWSYQYIDFLKDDDEYVEFDSYLVPETDLQNGALRMLEVDNRIIIPELTHTRFVVAGADVIHSFACPSLGLKCDAYPGRLNQSSLMVNRPSTFYGQCSEICGILHSSMPVVIEAVVPEKFVKWVLGQ